MDPRTGKADCGCVYSAEEGIPCQHDLALPLPPGQVCQDCQGREDTCPLCHCACELTARTIRSDEDAYCERCHVTLIQDGNGTFQVERPIA